MSNASISIRAAARPGGSSAASPSAASPNAASPSPAGTSPAGPGPVGDPIAPAYDRARLVELFGNDARTLAEVEQEFLQTARVAEREIVGSNDCALIARAAHRLKGASGMIGAARLKAIAEALEIAGKAEDLTAARRLLEVFRHEVNRVAEQVGGKGR
jgi:HPt (histidine-containing phosphotransfer) domain-containing protein